MRQAGGLIAADDLDERAWVDFGVDETWEIARTRRRPATPTRENADTRPRVVESALGAAGTVHRASPRSAGAVRSPRSAGAVRSPRSAGAARSPRSVSEQRSPRSVVPAPAPAPHEFVPLRSPRSLTELPEAPTASRTPAPVGPPADATPSVRGVPPRRTVTIRGRGAERELAFPSHRPARRPATRRHERPGFKPDRMAMWAVVLGMLLLLVAVTSSHAAVLAHVVH